MPCEWLHDRRRTTPHLASRSAWVRLLRGQRDMGRRNLYWYLICGDGGDCFLFALALGFAPCRPLLRRNLAKSL